ncbi:hypothetical protein AB0M86_49545 [Streptomyces sp. NPDC051639]|uniref:hypothetical protein n=1 Tax=Streptomyces sp. NPDC051639 TaxID=3155671 RepID=UPI00343F9D45
MNPSPSPDFERRMRYELAVALVDRLTPTVTVYESASPGGPMSDALARRRRDAERA